MRGVRVLSEQPLTGKTGDLGIKNNKETYILIKRLSFRSAQAGKEEQRIVYFEKGVFWSGPGRNSWVAKSEKWGGFRGAHTRTVLIWEYPAPLPRALDFVILD